MKNRFDHRELEYYDYLLQKNIEKDPDYSDKLKSHIITKRIYKKYIDQNELFLLNLKKEIPKFHVDMMSDLMKKYQGKYVSRYGLYRMCENYLTKTAWYQKLDIKSKYMINLDFYKTVILGIRRSLKLVQAYKKNNSQL